MNDMSFIRDPFDESVANFIQNQTLSRQDTLSEGDTNDDVIILQEKLKVLGYFFGTVTGSFGSTTEEAVKSFQRDNGLKVDGVVGSETWDLLYEKTQSPFPTPRVTRPTLKVGDTGEAVRYLQEQLEKLLYYTGSISGVFDNETEIAVKTFQMNNRLTADGIVGRDTWSALAYLYAPLAICGGEEVPSEELYTVQKGDTLWSIARKFDMTVDDLKRLNNLTSNTISIGQKLRVKESEGETPSPDRIYIVRAGDTLWSIARNFNTTVDELKRLNGLTSNVLSIGQQLILEEENGEVEPPTEENFYVVKRGDTLYSIARAYGIGVDELRRLNGLTSDILSIGQVLQVPSGEPSSTLYTVKYGDTLWGIARAFGTTVQHIRDINQLTSDVLSVGQQLRI